jgi:hypothetical protein
VEDQGKLGGRPKVFVDSLKGVLAAYKYATTLLGKKSVGLKLGIQLRFVLFT